MAKHEVYRARNGAPALADDAAGPSPFTIEVRFVGGLSQAQKDAFKAAANRWTSVIVGDLPSVKVDGEVIDDVLILAEGAEIDGVGQILGQAGPTALRPRAARKSALLPAKGEMTFDTADLEKMEANGTLINVITHEMGHVLGIGTIWQLKRLLKDGNSNNPVFVGPAAMAEFAQLKTVTKPVSVSVENTGGPGTRNGHWRDSVFGNELMTGFVGAAGNPLSRMTVASLKDLGYTVALNAADAYSLPSSLELAEMGQMGDALEPEGLVLPIIPTMLPEDSLQ